MSISRPFGYNNGPLISGTEQYGTLVVGVDELNYVENAGGVRWWNGPDEELGYVIATNNVDINGNPLQPTPNTPITGELGSVKFYRTKTFDDSSFIMLANKATSQNFTSGVQAKTYLLSNGYWTNWGGSDFVVSSGFWNDNAFWVDDAVWID